MACGRMRNTNSESNSHLTKKEIEQRAKNEAIAGSVPSDWLETPPKDLNADQKKEWLRILGELKKIDILGNLDYENVRGYIVYRDRWLKSLAQLKKEGDTIKVIDEETGDVLDSKANPLVNINLHYSQEMRRYEDLIGLTRSSRLRLAEDKVKKDNANLASVLGVDLETGDTL